MPNKTETKEDVMLSSQWRICTLIAAGFFVSIVGCTIRTGDFTVGSSRNIGLLSQKGDAVEGEDCSSSILFGFIPIAGPVQPNFKTAMDRALEKAKGDVVVDVVLWQSDLNLMLFSQHCFKVEGKVARGEFGKKM